MNYTQSKVSWKDELTLFLIVVTSVATLSACSAKSPSGIGDSPASSRTEEERHKLYASALAASDSPLENQVFKDVCRSIGIFDPGGNPNDKYLDFVAAHTEWGRKPETEQFRREISSREKAKSYVMAHLSQ